MSRRQRQLRDRSLRLRVARKKVLRRRARLTARPAAAAATVAALTMAGVGVSTDAVATSAVATSAVATSERANTRVAGAALATCGDPHTPTSNLSDFVDVGGRLFFSAGDGVHGRELWTSDGTKAGTVLVKDISPGTGGDYDTVPTNLTSVGGRIFFTADDGAHGQELWTSDGTKGGTVLVKDINPDNDDGYSPSSVARVGARVFFTADDGAHGPELWRSDGTKAGTVLVKDINPSASGYEYGPSSLTGVGARLFFTADDGAHGPELWRSDGTKAGTVLVKDITPSASEYEYGPSSLTGVRGRLFFTADDATHGPELWRSDGTKSGTVLVKDINPDATNGYAPFSLTGVGERLYFTADDGVHGAELWRSNGTRAGTVLVKDINPAVEEPGEYDDSPSSLTGVRGRLFFATDDGVHGTELWRSDGTRANTVLVDDVNKGGRFRVARHGTRNFQKGILKLKVRVAGAGSLVIGPAGRHLIRTSTKHLRAAGSTRVTLRPTAAGMRKLRHSLRVAHREGRKTGTLKVNARFTFTPCGGTASSSERRITLKLR
jgi:ELWxxDGT repeat protein